MKKILFIAAATLISASAFAQTVSSANVVGYSQIELAPGFTVTRMPFVNGTNSVDIQDAFDVSILQGGTSAGTADNIRFWDPVGLKYDTYFLHDGSGKGNLALTDKWIDGGGLIASNVVVQPSTSFFFSKAGATTITNVFSGDVVIAATGTNSLELLEGFNLVANPFTADWDLSDTNVDWIAKGAIGGTSAGTADSVKLWDPVGLKYDTYFLHDGSGKGNLALTGKWIDGGGLIASNLTVGIGEGLFYSRSIGSSTLTLEIDQPCTLD